MTRVYDIAGLTMRSALPLDVAGRTRGERMPDVEIRLCEVPRALGERATSVGDWQWEGVSALLEIPHVARFLVIDGRRIEIDAGRRSSSSRIEQAMHERVLEVLLLQRGLFAMHGTAIAIAGARVLLLGAERDVLRDAAEQLADVSRESIDSISAVLQEADLVLPASGELAARYICLLRPLLPRAACAEVVPMMPFAAFSWARGLARCGDLLATAGREGDFLRVISATFTGASLYELRWPMRSMSDSERTCVRQQLVPPRHWDVGAENRS